MKNFEILHEEEGQFAVGVFQLDGSGAPLKISDGIDARVQNHTEIPSSANLVAYTPPPVLKQVRALLDGLQSSRRKPAYRHR